MAMGKPESERPISGAVTWGLFAAWLVHDLEEALTFPRWARTALPRLRRQFPAVPQRVWDAADSTDGRQFGTAVVVMGGFMAAAAAAGAASRGQSHFYQRVLTGFGVHAVGHVASAVLTRGYTPGLITSPVVVVPYSAWAIRRLRGEGKWHTLSTEDVAPSVLLAAVSFGGSHAVARLVRGNRRAQRR